MRGKTHGTGAAGIRQWAAGVCTNASGRLEPVVDGLDIPDQPRTLYESGAFNHVPLIIGATRDEGWIYVDRSFPGGLTAAAVRRCGRDGVRRSRCAVDPGPIPGR